MWEESIKELDLDARPRKSLFSHPFFKDRIDQIIIFGIIVCSALIMIWAIKGQLFLYWADFLRSSKFLQFATYPLVFSAITVFAALILQTVLWTRYKPFQVLREDAVEWPKITVITAALNEQDFIGQAIDSVFASNYPKDKLDVVCINDGSKDLTLHHMLQARKRYPGRLQVVSFKKNLGKRKALYVGIKKAKGDIIVTFDSDSLLGRNALRNIVQPLIQDPKTACVAGRVAVLNEKQNFLTRMLSVRYAISFDYGRAYQSTYGTVVCCPGALTAYKKPVIASLMPEFLHQRFFNEPCNHGEDRALTTLILRTGAYVRYQANAVVYTTVPTTFKGMNKMYLRWTRSYVRESVFQARFVFTRYRQRNRALPIFDFIFLNFLHPFHLFSLGLVAYSFAVNPLFMLRHVSFLVLSSFILSLYYLRTNRSAAFLYGIPYGLITAFLLWWIVPFSVLTVKNQKWLTR